MQEYRFRPVETPDNEPLHDWLLAASESDLTGTLEAAQEIAAQFACKVVLEDAHGFIRGWATAEGFRLE